MAEVNVKSSSVFADKLVKPIAYSGMYFVAHLRFLEETHIYAWASLVLFIGLVLFYFVKSHFYIRSYFMDNEFVEVTFQRNFNSSHLYTLKIESDSIDEVTLHPKSLPKISALHSIAVKWKNAEGLYELKSFRTSSNQVFAELKNRWLSYISIPGAFHSLPWV